MSSNPGVKCLFDPFKHCLNRGLNGPDHRTDSYCGIYTANTFQHKLFGTPILRLPDCKLARLEWFKIFMHRAGLGVSQQSPEPGAFESHEHYNFFAEEAQPASAYPQSHTLERSATTRAACISSSGPRVNFSPSARISKPSPVPDEATDKPVERSDIPHPNLEPARNTALSSESVKRKRPSSVDLDTDEQRTTPEERCQELLSDPNTVKLPSGALKGTPHEVYCECQPNIPRKLQPTKDYIVKNWKSHQKTCALVTGTNPGSRTRTIPTPVVSTKVGISAFFTSKSSAPKKAAPITNPTTKREVVVADRRLGLRGEGYQEYAWQIGESFIGGVSTTEWVRLSRCLFPYKSWADGSSDSEDSDSADLPDEIPEKSVRDACALTTAVTLALKGIAPKTNKLPKRSDWTDFEKGRLHQSLLVAARWIVYAGTGSVSAKGCQGVTTSLDRTCSACTAVGHLDGLKRAIRRARVRARLPPDEFTKRMAKRLSFTPLMYSEHAAATAKASLATPAVMKILSSKAKHGPAGIFLSLYEQSLRGDLDDQETFVAISGQLTERVERSKDSSGRAIHSMRYSPMFAKYCTLMRSYGPRSGAQYDLMRGMTGGISPRQMRRRAAKSSTKMLSSELCAGNLFPALDFAKLMNYDGPWIAAGNGTKLRPLLTVSSEFSDKDSAHVMGSTFPLCNVVFKSSDEQSKITSNIDAARAIATHVWVLAIKIPLPGMPVFPVAFVPNQGKMKGTEYRDYHLKLRELCGELGMKLLASGADGAKSEVNAQQLMVNAKTEKHLSYTNEKYGVFLSCSVYPDTGPHICTTDPDHARKTARNNFLYSTHFLIVGFYFICHAILMFLLTLALVPLYIKDIFNPDKQDDGAARRLFANKLFKFLVTSNGELRHPSLEGVFILTFVFGELFDAWMKRSMPHTERVVCVFRARHFLTIWRSNIVNAESRYPDLFSKQSSFLADSSFLILMRFCDQFILLILAHLEHYRNVPFMPWHHGTHFLEHFFGIARSFIADFSFGQLIEMYKHILIRVRILASSQYNTKKEKDSNNGYVFDFVDSGLTTEEIAMLKDIPSRADIDRACETAWAEAQRSRRNLLKCTFRHSHSSRQIFIPTSELLMKQLPR
ncbi:hypothetical protein C8J57DRAFT_1241344 [Mycena rebaudengoi]|nr:hypothetical protein C8J57DRAFT_1241344 [Mycena rebaudengoi]